AALVQAWTGWARAGIEREQPAAHVIALHPGLDLEHYRPEPATAREPRERRRALFVGGRFAEKGGEDLLAAAAPRLARGELELDLVTRADVQPRPGVRVHHLQSGDAHLLELYRQADVLCLPTHGDSVPWVVLEAMACGLPVLSTRVGAIPELLDGGRCGV